MSIRIGLRQLIESIIQDDQLYLTENLSNQSRGSGKPSGNVSESLVRGFVREILSEDAYKKRTGKRFTDDVEKIRNNLDKEGYFLHFSDVPKIGINPKSRYLPGVYFYPNIKEIYDGFVKNVVGTYRGAGRASRYVFLVRLKDGLNIVEGEQIKERAHETLRSISKPLLDLDIDDSSRVGREKDFKQEVFHRLEGISSNMADPQLKSIDQIDSKLLEKVYKNYSDLGEIYKDFINRPRMSEKQKEEFIKKLNGRLAEYRKRFGPTAAGVAPTLEGLDPKSVEKFNIRIKSAMSPAKISPNGELRLTDADIDKELKDLSREYPIRYSETGPSIAGINRAAVLQATIALNGSSAMVKSFVEYFAEPVQDIKNTTKFLRWLLDKNDLQLQLRSGETASLADLKAQCVKRLEETMGNNYTRLMKAVNGADLVGVNILLVMGSGIVDGINDTGRNKSDIVWGHGGILGKYEGAQLFLSAPVTNKFEIVTMIDRYEGESESWEPPGSATPDREAGSTSEFAVNPREPSLKARLSREVPGEKQQMKTIPRERWS